MACLRDVTFGPFFEPEWSEPDLNSSITLPTLSVVAMLAVPIILRRILAAASHGIVEDGHMLSDLAEVRFEAGDFRALLHVHAIDAAADRVALIVIEAED